jgi:uncharacterized glyoxalase superfamily protein PhnB
LLPVVTGPNVLGHPCPTDYFPRCPASILAISAHFPIRIHITFDKKMKQNLLVILMVMLISLATAQTKLAGNEPASMESVSPNIFVRDIKATIDFYKILGFKVATTVPEGNDPVFVMMTCGTATFMFQTFRSIENSLPIISRTDGASLLLYIKVKDIRSLYEKIKDRIPILHEMEKTFYGATEFSIKDNNNYLLTFAQND